MTVWPCSPDPLFDALWQLVAVVATDDAAVAVVVLYSTPSHRLMFRTSLMLELLRGQFSTLNTCSFSHDV